MTETASLFECARWGLKDYREGTRSYRLTCERFPDLKAKIFHERDIPVQVAVGNYDLGICGLDWVEELMVKYPSAALVKLRDFAYGEGAVYAVAADNSEPSSLETLCGRWETIRLVSEYPNLAESFALRLRLKRFSVFPLWGAAEVYPPEDADLALMPAKKADGPFNHGLKAVDTVLYYNACLIANRDCWQSKDLSDILQAIEQAAQTLPASQLTMGDAITSRDILSPSVGRQPSTKNEVRLALPDGHQQPHTVAVLNKAGIRIKDYPSPTGNRRPQPEEKPGLSVKVIRPQDMPMQVAAGNFDMAITGEDWLRDHLYQFPSSPVTGLVNLKYGRVRIVALVNNDLPVSGGEELRELWATRREPIRVASEYTNIADKYARENHFKRYRIIPTWGASEAFLPEDADLLIENTETGRTIAQHNLKIVDTLFESTGQLIANKDSLTNTAKRPVMQPIIDALRKAVEN
jgi:ATP phosphoribosyltransferase